jgi:hypothetical protein
MGIGAANPHHRDDIIPLITWEAVPGSVYVVRPSSNWYCTSGQHTSGEIVDSGSWNDKTHSWDKSVALLGISLASIDLASGASHYAFSYNDDGTGMFKVMN